MTINIRCNIFETNSSSSHSVSFSFPLVGVLETIPPDNNGNIILNGGDFASVDRSFNTALEKANFIAVYIMTYGNFSLKQRFEKIIKNHTGAKNIIYNIYFTYYKGKKANTFFSPDYAEACVDNDYFNENFQYLTDIFDDDEKIKNFIFNKEVCILSDVTYNG